ncbi:MAG: uracil-DNA glycosylase family protein [Thalassovita sp.]
MSLQDQISACRLCADRFAKTKTAHAPRPVPWFRASARILIAGQAPGMRVHQSGKPFDDRSGERLRDWLGMSPAQFYDRDHVAVVPAAFCFPGYSSSGADLPPPKICAQTWQAPVQDALPHIELRIVIGGYAHKNLLGVQSNVTETVRNWRHFAPKTFVLPHPSWRNTGWIKKHPWFAQELLPELRQCVAALRQ